MQALGMIETVGLAAAIEAADTAVKSANVTLVGYELTKGGGMVTVKFEGDVGAVKAAVEAGTIAASRVGKVFSKHIIPRVGSGVDKIVYSNDTVGPGNPLQIQKTTTVDHPISLEQAAPDEQIIEEHHSDADEADKERTGFIEVCNICNDPTCPRRKGDIKSSCIHYKELRRNVK
ncbi:BMC domain-containing protein [Schinkia sp. CFF1]